MYVNLEFENWSLKLKVGLYSCKQIWLQGLDFVSSRLLADDKVFLKCLGLDVIGTGVYPYSDEEVKNV